MEYGKGWGERHLRHCIRLDEAFPDATMLHTLCSQFSCSHLRLLMRIDDPVETRSTSASASRSFATRADSCGKPGIRVLSKADSREPRQSGAQASFSSSNFVTKLKKHSAGPADGARPKRRRRRRVTPTPFRTGYPVDKSHESLGKNQAKLGDLLRGWDRLPSGIEQHSWSRHGTKTSPQNSPALTADTTFRGRSRLDAFRGTRAAVSPGVQGTASRRAASSTRRFVV
jgi:hypothetical protein